MQQPSFQIRGVIEGFYGPFYTWPERLGLLRFIGEHGFNLYIYAPKNDRQHRARWWEAYPPAELAQFRAALAVAAEVGVRFCYALSPLGYEPERDWARVTRKLAEMFDLGVRHFSILADDLTCAQHQAASCAICPWSAERDVALGNALLAWLRERDPACSLSFCPTLYHGRAPFPGYVYELGAGLDPAIDLFYTGPAICSPAVAVTDAYGFAAAVGRPPLLWDNYPVNDLAMRAEMHFGPIRGRAPALPTVLRGIVINPMLQPEASKIPLLTWAEYLADPEGYEPWAAWERALLAVGGERNYAALRHFGENALESCLPLDGPRRLEQLVRAALPAVDGPEIDITPELSELSAYLETLDEACYELKNRMDNHALRHDLLPWVESLDEWTWIGKRAMRLAEALAAGAPTAGLADQLTDQLAEAQRQPKRTAGHALEPMARALLGAARRRSTELPLALPDVSANDMAVAWPAGSETTWTTSS